MKKHDTVKRKVTALTAIVLSLSVLAACGNKDNESDSSKPSVTVEERPVETEVKTETVTVTNKSDDDITSDTSSESLPEDNVQEVVDDSNFDPANIPVVGTESKLYRENELTTVLFSTGLAGSDYVFDHGSREGKGIALTPGYKDYSEIDKTAKSKAQYKFTNQPLNYIDIKQLKNTEPENGSKETTETFDPYSLTEYSTPIDIPEELSLISTKNGFTFNGQPAYLWKFNQSELSSTNKLTDVVFMETQTKYVETLNQEVNFVTALLFDSDYYNQEILPYHHFLFAPAADSYSGDVNGFRLGDTKEVVERAIGHVALKPGNIEITDEPVKGLEKNGEDGYLYSFYQNYYGTKFIVGYKDNVAKRVIMISPERELIG